MDNYKHSKIVATYTQGAGEFQRTFRVVKLSKATKGYTDAAAVELLDHDSMGGERWELCNFFDFEGTLDHHEALIFALCEGDVTL